MNYSVDVITSTTTSDLHSEILLITQIAMTVVVLRRSGYFEIRAPIRDKCETRRTGS